MHGKKSKTRQQWGNYGAKRNRFRNNDGYDDDGDGWRRFDKKRRKSRKPSEKGEDDESFEGYETEEDEEQED